MRLKCSLPGSPESLLRRPALHGRIRRRHQPLAGERLSGQREKNRIVDPKSGLASPDFFSSIWHDSREIFQFSLEFVILSIVS